MITAAVFKSVIPLVGLFVGILFTKPVSHIEEKGLHVHEAQRVEEQADEAAAEE